VRRAVFFDRDGVLNELVERGAGTASPRRVADFRLVPEAVDVIRRLRAAGLGIFVVTNQPDVARGYLSREELEQMHGLLRDRLAPDDIVVCPHDDADGCQCRKPLPGMLYTVASRWSVDLEASVLVGDSWRDVEAGRRAGCSTVLVAGFGRPGGHAPGPDGPTAVVETLGEAAEWILQNIANGGE
jgi:D-glycero-D-manno-heptose 1,7-bisphosphate phosphatase